MVYVDENGGAELDRMGGVVEDIDGCGSAADVRGALVDGDIETGVGFCSVFAQIVGC